MLEISMTKFYKSLALIFFIAILFGGFFILFNKKAEAPIEEKSAVALPENKEEKPVEENNIAQNIFEPSIPAKISISVPFTSQAPFGKWDIYHEEACEEASLIMVAYFLQNKKLTPAIAEKEIQNLIAYEIKTTGKYEDSTAWELAELGEKYYGIKNLRVVYDFIAEDLKKYLAKGKPIIIPAAGRMLKNPNFKYPGPLYHNLVLTGYDGDTIIANDPGTRKGENYRYNIKIIYNAIHDFPGDKTKIETGRKAMIVVE